MRAIGAEGRHATVPKIFRGIPTIPKFKYPGPIRQALADVNYIKELNAIPCAPASPEIYIKTALNTGVPALLSLGLPGCNDILKTKIGLSPWHARSISGAIKKATAPSLLGGNNFLYKVGYFAAEKYLWFFQVAEVTKEFFITWQSQVFMAQQCQLPGAGTAHGYIAPFIYTANQTGPLGIAPIKLCPGVANGLASITILPGFQGTFGFSCTWDSWPTRGGAGDVQTWYTEEGIDEARDLSHAWDPETGQNGTTGGHWYYRNMSINLGHTFSLWMNNNSDQSMQVVAGTWSCSVQGRHSGLSSFGCAPQTPEWPFPNPLKDII
jgi:hypothetical protein